MAHEQIQHILLFTIIAVCTCVQDTDRTTSPNPGAAEARRTRRSPEDNWPGVYPYQIATIGGQYTTLVNGEYTHADLPNLLFTMSGTYNERPVYKSDSGSWSIYYRVSGYAANSWVLDFNEVDEDWDGSVAVNRGDLFSSDV